MRKPHFYLQFIFSLLNILFFITSCQPDLQDPRGNNPVTPNPIDMEMVTGGVSGNVVDENNQPVVGATVTSGSASTTTDRYGSFKFRNISLSKNNGTVKVVKAGYFNGFRSFISVAGRINNVRIKLLPKANSGTFQGSTGGTITINGGGKLVMPAASITDAGGTAYTGTVNIAMTWIDPSSPDLPNIVMGDLRGITTSGEERGLSTYGMLGVEMTGSSGQSLKIAAGKTAELTFPVPASLQGSAPATIDLWHFDEASARWKQEGTANKVGNNYVAQVSHFSFWNCDAPFPLINLCMSFITVDNNSMNNVQVRIKRVVNGTYAYGRTDSTGNLCGLVPKNEALVIEVLDQCNQVIYSQNAGPFSANTTLTPIGIAIPAPNNLIITGTVTNCAGTNVTNGGVAIYITGGNYYSVPVTNGTFTLSLLRCSGGTVNFTVLGIDYSTMQQSVPAGGTGSTGTVNVGTIQACGTSSAQYLEWLIDGVPTNFASPPDNIHTDDTTIAGTYNNKTWISASKQNPGVNSIGSFSFNNNSVVANGLPINSISFFDVVSGSASSQIITPTPTLNITTYGPPITGFIEGNFNVQMDFSGIPKTVICNFRVRRN
ncbi:hypothetical protein CAP36_04755 [Chitinophagaceae bacterium IBVUCB2]|nr:hypothetical protein CAP36_04755 [Chitinophagaceae bacterium IBVUCB2]